MPQLVPPHGSESVKPLLLPETERPYFARLAPDFGLHLQEGADLGARLDRALQHYLKPGNGHAVIMDSDSPTLPSAYVGRAFDLLDGADVVLGPCEDGGYYLIGLNRPSTNRGSDWESCLAALVALARAVSMVMTRARSRSVRRVAHCWRVASGTFTTSAVHSCGMALLWHASSLAMKPPTKEPAMPRMPVMRRPRCSTPGMIHRAMAPTMMPTMNIQR